MPEEESVVDGPVEKDFPTDKKSHTTFQLSVCGTKRKGKKLFDSLGYSYTIKRRNPNVVYWECAIRQKNLRCPASVIERNFTFRRGNNHHIHFPQTGSSNNKTVFAPMRNTVDEKSLQTTAYLKDVEVKEPVDSSEPQLSLTKMENLEASVADPVENEWLADGPQITFQLINFGTKRKGKKLVDSLGYSYTIKRRRKDVVYWECSLRPKNLRCPASVIERNFTFKRGNNFHIHPPDTDVDSLTPLKRKVKSTTCNKMQSQKIFRQEVCERLEHMDQNLAISRRLEQLETRLDDVIQQQQNQHQTNSLLTQILSELSRLSQTFANHQSLAPHSMDITTDVTIVASE